MSRVPALGAPAAPAALLSVVLGLALASCGGAQETPGDERIDPRRHEIRMRWAQIREWRQDAGLPGAEPPRGEILEMHGRPMSQAKGVCPAAPEPATPRCEDVCRLAEAICENAEGICRIAGELAGDAWAQDKCSSAKASCKEAKKACCRCRDSEVSE